MLERVRVSLVLEPGTQEPSYETEGAAGMDLRSSETLELGPMERAAIPTGVRVSIPFGYEGQVRPDPGWRFARGLLW